jgi:hypothetical protein
MVQATVLDGLVFDAPPFGENGFASAEVDVSRCQIADALVVAAVVVVIDQGCDGGFQFTFEEVVFQHEMLKCRAASRGLMPSAQASRTFQYMSTVMILPPSLQPAEKT